MPIFEEFKEAVANENLAVGASYPAQRLQHSTMDFDRVRTIMADNAAERQNEQNRSYHLLNSRLLKDLVEPDVESVGAYKEMLTGISPTSQGYHFANQNQQINASLTSSIHQLGATISSLKTMMAQLIELVN